ncbi:site-specific integrase [Dehalococcoidia bacterium]|nr:site-specific integrase [Dehalococcoidia bacterium]
MKGHIRKRSKGSWTLWIDLGRDPETGKRKQQTMTVPGTKKDAERELRATLTRLEEGAYVKPAKLTVGEYLDQWLQGYVSSNVGPRTRERYVEIVRTHLIPALGSIPLAALQPQHIQTYYGKALDSGRRDGKGGLSARTVQQYHRILHEALKHAVKHGTLIRNAAEAVDAPRPEHKEMATLAPEDVNRLLDAVRDTPYYVPFYTAIYTGLRRSELLALRWFRVDLELATLSVVETLHRLKNREFVFGQPKSKRGRRLITLSPSLAILLREHKARQEFERMFLGKPLSPNDLVFSNPDGSPLKPDCITQAFTRITRAIGLYGVRFHDLRHTHATLMLWQGIHPKIVSERLGHSSIAITLDTYSHVLPGLQEAAALRFEEGLQGTSVRVLAEVG